MFELMLGLMVAVTFGMCEHETVFNDKLDGAHVHSRSLIIQGTDEAV